MFVWGNRCMLLFCLLFALEPVIGNYKYYWCLMLLLGVAAFALLIGYIKKEYNSPQIIPQSVKDIEKTSLPCLLISIFGIIISHIYKSTLFKFWIFVFFIELVIYIQKVRKAT